MNTRHTIRFEEMANVMVLEYNSDARQLQDQRMLENLRLEKHRSENDISNPSEGLTQIIELLEHRIPQSQLQLCFDSNEIIYLCKAVVGFSLAMTPTGNIITANYSFNGFGTALRELI